MMNLSITFLSPKNIHSDFRVDVFSISILYSNHMDSSLPLALRSLQPIINLLSLSLQVYNSPAIILVSNPQLSKIL